MKKNSAFTLLELLIATAISGFIIVSIMQGYRNAQKIHLKIRRTLDANHTACLFFNQIERDILTAFIPQEDTKKKDVKEEEKEQKIKGKKTDKKENGTLYFKASVYENQTKKIDDKKYELFKTLNFINTNPLQVWGQKLVRQVRIAYMLTLDKKNSTNNRNVYKLYRKETTDIKNVKFKEPEIINRKKPEHPVRKHLVAKNIKELYIEYIMPKSQNPKDDDKQDPEEKILKSFRYLQVGNHLILLKGNFSTRNLV